MALDATKLRALISLNHRIGLGCVDLPVTLSSDDLVILLDVLEAAHAVAAHRHAETVDSEAWNRERVRLAERLDEALKEGIG